MILGLGLDLCQIARIEGAMARNPRFAERVFTDAERARIAARGAQTAAGYFAAKEAISKALGTGFAGFCMRDIEILPDASGRPRCRLYGGARAALERLGANGLLVTITHDAGVAAAVAIADTDTNSQRPGTNPSPDRPMKDEQTEGD